MLVKASFLRIANGNTGSLQRIKGQASLDLWQLSDFLLLITLVFRDSKEMSGMVIIVYEGRMAKEIDMTSWSSVRRAFIFLP